MKDMKMVSMKRTPEEKKENNKPSVTEAAATNGPDYPYGLEVRLEDESLKKLGMDMSKHKIGDEVKMMAKCKITGMDQHESDGGKGRKSMSMQIMDMCMDGMGEMEDEDDGEELDWGTDKKAADRKLKKKGLLRCHPQRKKPEAEQSGTGQYLCRGINICTLG